MGEMVMKKLFNKENFLFPSLDKHQKHQSLFVSLGLMLLFVFAAFTFFNALYCFADCVGSIVSGSPDVAIKDLLRSLPIILSSVMSIWALLLFHASFRNASEERRIRSYKKNSIALIAMSGVNILYIFISRFTGKFHSLVEGSPSPIYPLDAILFSLFYLCIGVCTLLYVLKWKDARPYEVPTRGPIVQKARFIYCFGVSIWMLISLFTFAAFFLGLFIIDFLHGYQFYSIMLLVAYALSFLYLLVWEFFYNEVKEEKKKEYLLPLGICGTSLSVLVLILYFVSLGLNLDGPAKMGFGVLPVAFAASVNIATMVVVICPFVVSLICLIKGLVARKK